MNIALFKIGRFAAKRQVPPIFEGSMGYYSSDRVFLKIGIGMRTDEVCLYGWNFLYRSQRGSPVRARR